MGLAKVGHLRYWTYGRRGFDELASALVRWSTRNSSSGNVKASRWATSGSKSKSVAVKIV